MRHTPGLGIKSVDWKNRAQFLGIAAEIMRRILTHHARNRAAAKRGGHAQRVSLSFAERAIPQPNVDLISLDEAPELSSFDERKGRIVELKFFGEMTNEEISEVLKVSVGTLNEIGILHMTGCIVQFLVRPQRNSMSSEGWKRVNELLMLLKNCQRVSGTNF